MDTVTTNVRFPAVEYEELRKLAFIQRKSVAAIVREATKAYRQKKLATAKTRRALFTLIRSSAVHIRVPVITLIKTGGRFE